MEFWAAVLLVPLTAVGLLVVQPPPEARGSEARPQFDFESWVAKCFVYSHVNPRKMPMNVTQVCDWVNGFVNFEPLNVLPFTPTLTCEPRVSLLLDRFDWRLFPDPEHRRDYPNLTDMTCGSLDSIPWKFERVRDDPQTVYATPHALRKLWGHMRESADPNRTDRVLVLAGTEMPLSAAFGRTEAERNFTVKSLRRYFGRIVVQTKDIAMEHVHVAPMGLSWGYNTLLVGTWSGWPMPYAAYLDWALNVFSRTKPSTKSHNVLAAWGKVAGWLERPRTLHRCRQYRKEHRLFPPSNSSLEAIEAASASRKALRAWLDSPGAAAVGAVMQSLKPSDYWGELLKYKFLLAPMGSNIQTAKTIEALLALAVPIIQPMGFKLFSELLAMGFPLVLVDSWNEVTVENTTAWWKALSPRLESFRRNCLTVDGWWSMYIGRVSTCQ